jgi:hypothetical protein
VRLAARPANAYPFATRRPYTAFSTFRDAVDFAERALVVNYAIENVLVDANNQPAGTDVDAHKKRCVFARPRLASGPPARAAETDVCAIPYSISPRVAPPLASSAASA